MTPTLDSLIKAIRDRSTEPLLQLDAASTTADELDELGDALLNHFVDRCRRSGHSWSEIGGHLGVTRQAAQKRFFDPAGPGIAQERLTARARESLEQAQVEARGLRHNYIGTEHLLLGLIDTADGVAAHVLRSHAVDRPAVLAAVNAPAVAAMPTSDLPYTPRARKSLEDAVAASVALGHNYVGTEHILLGVAQSNGSVAEHVLSENGASPDVLRAEVIKELDAHTTTAAPAPKLAEHTGKYRALWQWLTRQQQTRIQTTFGDLEEVIGFSLPRSSRDHEPHWYIYQGSAVARAIIDAGWRARDVNLSAETLTLVKEP